MTFTAVLHSEWIKARSLPALTGIALLLFAATAGFSVLAAATLGRENAGKPDFDPLLICFYGVNFGQAVAIAFGALCAAAQYKNNGTRIWLAAVPRRGLMYTANLAVIGGVTLIAGLVTGLTCFLAGQPFIEDRRLGLEDLAAWRGIVGCAVYLALIALFAAGVATVLRSSAAAMGILIPLVLLLSFMLGDVTQQSGFVEFLPDRAGRQVLVEQPTGTLGPWTGLLVTAAWAGAAGLLGWTALSRRDA